jgi:hypothetical protein
VAASRLAGLLSDLSPDLSQMNAIREHESNTGDQLYPREKPSATFFRPGRSADRLPMVLAGYLISASTRTAFGFVGLAISLN